MKKLICGWCLMLIGVAVLTAQQRTIEQAIQGAQRDIEQELPKDNKVIVINFNSSNNALSEYVLDTLARLLTNGKKLQVIDRQEGLKFIQNEVRYQYGGDVKESEMAAMGQQAGAQWIIYGKYNDRIKEFSILAVNVETAVREVSYATEIKADKKLDQLMDITLAEQQQKEEEQRQKEAERRRLADQREENRRRRQPAAVQRTTKFILGFRGGMTFMFNELNNTFGQSGFEKNEAAHLGEVFSFYFGSNSQKSLVGFQLEGNLTLNNGMTLTRSTYALSNELDFSYMSLDIPVLLRFGIGGISLFGGPYISIPLTPLTMKDNNSSSEYKIEKIVNIMSSWGILGGLTFGIKAGPGYIVLDGRYMYDFNEISYLHSGGTQPLFRRHGINATIGYEFWL